LNEEGGEGKEHQSEDMKEQNKRTVIYTLYDLVCMRHLDDGLDCLGVKVSTIATKNKRGPYNPQRGE
jgi:hypothetical protein